MTYLLSISFLRRVSWDVRKKDLCVFICACAYLFLFTKLYAWHSVALSSGSVVLQFSLSQSWPRRDSSLVRESNCDCIQLWGRVRNDVSNCTLQTIYMPLILVLPCCSLFPFISHIASSSNLRVHIFSFKYKVSSFQNIKDNTWSTQNILNNTEKYQDKNKVPHNSANQNHISLVSC